MYKTGEMLYSQNQIMRTIHNGTASVYKWNNTRITSNHRQKNLALENTEAARNLKSNNKLETVSFTFTNG